MQVDFKDRKNVLNEIQMLQKMQQMPLVTNPLLLTIATLSSANFSSTA